MGYTFIDFVYGIVVFLSGTFILLLIKYIYTKFYEWLKKIREVSDEVIKNRERIEELEEKFGREQL